MAARARQRGARARESAASAAAAAAAARWRALRHRGCWRRIRTVAQYRVVVYRDIFHSIYRYHAQHKGGTQAARQPGHGGAAVYRLAL